MNNKIGILILFILSTIALSSCRGILENSLSEESELVSEYPGIDIFFESYADDLYSYSYFIPLTDSSKIDRAIFKLLDNEKESFLDEVESLPDDNEWTSNMHIRLDTHILDEEEKIYSLVFIENKLLAGSNSEEKINAYNFNLSNNKIYRLDDLVDINIRDFKEIVRSEIKDNPDLSKVFFEDEFDKGFTSFKDIDFTIQNSNLYILFDSYEITPGSLGNLAVHIPHGKIGEDLTKEGKKVLGLEEAPASSNEDKLIIDNEKTMDTNKDPLLRGDNPIANSEDPAISNEETTSSEKPYLDMTIIANEEPGQVSPNQETGPAHTGKIALTFDDGPHPSETLRLLDILDQYNAKATFFVLGKNTEYYPDIVREISNRGHEIANHTYSHPDLTSLSYGEILYELQMADQIIIEATGTKPRLVRPPYGSVDEETKAAIRDNGQTLVTWTVDTRDWDHRDPYQSLEIVKENAGLGDIILMHDVHSSSVDAVPQIIEYLQGQGYELTTVSDIL